MTGIEAVVYSSSSVSEARLRVDDRVNTALSRETALLGNARLGLYSAFTRATGILQDRARRERQLQAADLIKSWLDAPDDGQEEGHYEILEQELKKNPIRFREG